MKLQCAASYGRLRHESFLNFKWTSAMTTGFRAMTTGFRTISVAIHIIKGLQQSRYGRSLPTGIKRKRLKHILKKKRASVATYEVVLQ